MKSVGIDIGSSSIKVVEVNLNNKGQLKLTRYVDHPLGLNPAFDPEIQIIEFLKTLAASYEANSAKFVMALSQDKVSVRHKLFPFNDRLKIQKSLAFELEEDLPFSSETAIFDAKIIRTRGNSAEVLACATPKIRVAEFQSRFGDLGLDITTLSAEGIALANCFERWFESPPASPTASPLEMEDENRPLRNITAVISIGHSRTLINAYENNQLVGARCILWGAKYVAEAIARRYEIPYLDAIKELQTKGFILTSKEGASYDQIVFSDTISGQFKELCRDINISLLELKAELHGQILNVGLTGGGSQVLNLQAFMTTQLEVPCNKIQVLENFPQVAFEKSEKIDATIGVALGLAIEGLKKPRNPAIQFLRSEFAAQNHVFKQFWHTWGTSLQFALAFYLVFSLYSGLRDNFAQSLNERTHDALIDKAKKVANLGKKEANEKGVKKYIREQKKRGQELKTLANVSRLNSALDVLKKVNDAIPARNSLAVNVRHWSVTDSQAIFEGTVNSARDLQQLQQALGNVAIDGKVEARAARMAPAPGALPFAFSFKVDRGVIK